MNDKFPNESNFVLGDYDESRLRWDIHVGGGRLLHYELAGRFPGADFVSGVFHLLKVSEKDFPLGFFSKERISGFDAPDYRSSLIIIAGGRLWGDGYIRPEIMVRDKTLKRRFVLSGRGMHSVILDYKPPRFRELLRRLNSGGTIDYQPVDFIEAMMQVVSINRPEWLIA